MMPSVEPKKPESHGTETAQVAFRRPWKTPKAIEASVDDATLASIFTGNDGYGAGTGAS
jgi:hypothetical protein